MNAAARAVDVQRDVPPPLGLDPHQEVVDLLDRVGLADVGRAEHRADGDRVLVDVLLDVVGATARSGPGFIGILRISTSK